MKPLVLGLGNELLGDDAIGILAARELAKELSGEADIVESSLSGVALLDLFVGYEKAIIIDAVKMEGFSPGTIMEFDLSELRSVRSPSPHFTGLPELIALAAEMKLHFPGEIKIFAVQADDPYTVGGAMSQPVKDALDDLVIRIKTHIQRGRTSEITASVT